MSGGKITSIFMAGTEIAFQTTGYFEEQISEYSETDKSCS
jgi:hypothetical protein